MCYYCILFCSQNLPSINSQCPVSTQMQTMNNAIEKDSSSAVVKRPHMPNEILKNKQKNKNVKKNMHILNFDYI